MAPLVYLIIFFAIVAPFSRRILAVFRRQRISRQHSCAPPGRYPLRDPILGFDLTFEMLQ
jgi:hypothetical protein